MVIVYCIHKTVLDVGESKANKTDEVPAPEISHPNVYVVGKGRKIINKRMQRLINKSMACFTKVASGFSYLCFGSPE